MENINIIIKDAIGREIKASLGQVEEDVLRMRMGLGPKGREGRNERSKNNYCRKQGFF